MEGEEYGMGVWNENVQAPALQLQMEKVRGRGRECVWRKWRSAAASFFCVFTVSTPSNSPHLFIPICCMRSDAASFFCFLTMSTRAGLSLFHCSSARLFRGK